MPICSSRTGHCKVRADNWSQLLLSAIIACWFKKYFDSFPIFLQIYSNLLNSQINLLRSQTTLIKGNAHFPILEIAMAIPVSRKSALTFTLCILASHDEKLVN